jgi:prepilin peptidase CpaA
MISSLALLLFPLLMAFAASTDLLTMRISNGVVAVLVCAFAVAALVARLPLELVGMHLLAAGLVLAGAFVCFAFGWIGGGDAKLAAATALWLGFGLTLPYLVYAGLLGGALTLLILAVRRWPLPAGLGRIAWIDRLHDSKSGVPYGIALAVAGIMVYADSPIFQRLVG